MADAAPPAPEITRFLTRWRASGAAERANYQLFLSELCDLLQVPRPHPALPDEECGGAPFPSARSRSRVNGQTCQRDRGV